MTEFPNVEEEKEFPYAEEEKEENKYEIYISRNICKELLPERLTFCFIGVG